MSEILQVQNFLFYGFMSCARFDPFNIVLEREFLAQSVIEFDGIWLKPRRLNLDGSPATPIGNGFYIEMPRLEVPHPNSLQCNIIASVVSIEERNINMTPIVGTQVSSEEGAKMALDFMRGWLMGLSSGLTPEVGAIKPAPDVIQGDGLIANRAAVSFRMQDAPKARCATPTLTEGPTGTFTLANGAATPDADLYYTVAGDRDDLSMPGRANPDATKYEGPFQLAAGQCVNCAAWRDDLFPSHVIAKIIS